MLVARCGLLFSLKCSSRNVDDRHRNEDKAVEVNAETGVLRKIHRPGMGIILAKERVGEEDDSQSLTIITISHHHRRIGALGSQAFGPPRSNLRSASPAALGIRATNSPLYICLIVCLFTRSLSLVISCCS